MKDSADPLDGWNYADVLDTPYGAATNDVYGKLFKYLESLFSAFHFRLKMLNVDFQMFNVDAVKLEDYLPDGTFARVEVRGLFTWRKKPALLKEKQVSNISDGWCLGAARTVSHLGGFLQTPTINPHATLISLFMNAVDEEMTKEDERQNVKTELMDVMRYMPFTGAPPSTRDPLFLMRDASRPLVRDNDRYFNR